MSSRDIDPFDWLNRFLGRRGDRAHGYGLPDIFRGFGEMRREMERVSRYVQRYRDQNTKRSSKRIRNKGRR